MELRQLRYFVAICEHGTFSKAAEKVFVAQSALSHQLAQLENELGAALFHRSRRGVALTEAGEIFHPHAVSILRQVDDARASVASIGDTPAGKVVLGIPHSASNALALPILTAVRAELPRVELDLTEELPGNLTRQLFTGSLHLAILFDDGQLDDFVVEPMVSERMSLIGRADLLGKPTRRSVSLGDALRSPLILPAQPHGVRPIIEMAAARAGLPPANVIADISSISILRTSLLAGMGCTILPIMPLKPEIDRGQLVALPIRSPGVTRMVALCRSRQIPLSAAARSVGLLVQRVAHDLCARGAWADASAL